MSTCPLSVSELGYVARFLKLKTNSTTQQSTDYERGSEQYPTIPTANMRAAEFLPLTRKLADPVLPTTSPRPLGSPATKRQAANAFYTSEDNGDWDELNASGNGPKRRRQSAVIDGAEMDSTTWSTPQEKARRRSTLTEIASLIPRQAQMEGSPDTDITLFAEPAPNSALNRAEFSFIHPSSRDQTWIDGDTPEYEEWGCLDVSVLSATELVRAARQQFSPSLLGIRLKYTETQSGKERIRSHKIDAGTEAELDLSRFKERWMVLRRANQLKDKEVKIYPLTFGVTT